MSSCAARERQQQQIEHHVGRPAQVIAELKLAKVRLHVLLADRDIGAIDAALDEVPEAFDVEIGRAHV